MYKIRDVKNNFDKKQILERLKHIFPLRRVIFLRHFSAEWNTSNA